MATLQEDAKTAIDAVFHDSSVDIRVTAERLEELVDHIEESIAALRGDMPETEE